MKNLKLKRFFTLFLALALIIAMIPLSTASAASYNCTRGLDELKSMFPHGRYWNHVGLKNWDITTTTDRSCYTAHKHGNCGYSGNCGCNSFKGHCSQCMGFAYALQYLAFDGFNGYLASRNYSYSKSMNSLKAGDVIRYGNHSIFVTGVNGNTITYMDCNGGGNGCMIRQDQTISKATVKKTFKYITSAPCELRTGNADNVADLFETAVVTSRTTLIIRENPDINSRKVGSLRSGETVKVCNFPLTDSNGYTWRLLVDGRGWVCADYLSIQKGMFMADGVYKIRCDHTGKYLTYADSPRNDSNIVIHDDLAGTNRADNQLWRITPLFYFSDWGAIIYRITPANNSSYSLDCDQGNNELLHLWESLDIGAQEWILDVRHDGSVRIVNNGSRLALDIMNYGTENNTEVITWNSVDTINQSFRLINP